MTAVFHRDPLDMPPLAAAGEGVFLVDQQGRRYLDASGGAAVSCLGHGDRRVIEAIKEQAERLAFAHTAFFSNEPSEQLASFLIERAPDGLGKAYFVSGGSEAVETALKLARQYHVARGESERTVFIARRQSYHGNTLGALSVSGNPGRRKPYEPILPGAVFIEPCYPYRHRDENESLEAYGLRAADDLERAIMETGPERVAAFIAEPVVGATLGAAPAAPGYLQRIREICDRHGVLFISDEVMCGMGRAGSLFAAAYDGVSPDIIVCAKGLGGGYQPIGAALANNRVYEAIVSKIGRFEHGHTYVGHPIACAAALAVQQAVEADGLVERAAASGEQLRVMLERMIAPTGILGEVRGRGAMIGVELVANPETKEPFPADYKLHARVKKMAFANGLIVYPGGGCVDGKRGDHVLIAPPYIAEAEHLEMIASILAASIAGALERAAA